MSQDPEATEICGATFRGLDCVVPIICTRSPHEDSPAHSGFAPATWYDGGKFLYVAGV